jgi:glycine cleavage system H protein
MVFPDELKYTRDHEWIRIEGEIGWIGITDYAQNELGEIVFVDVETQGEMLAKGEVFGSIEAVKTVSDLLMPVSGEVLELNEVLEEKPELVNQDAYLEGWIIKVKISDSSETDALLSASEYRSFIGK